MQKLFLLVGAFVSFFMVSVQAAQPSIMVTGNINFASGYEGDDWAMFQMYPEKSGYLAYVGRNIDVFQPAPVAGKFFVSIPVGQTTTIAVAYRYESVICRVTLTVLTSNFVKFSYENGANNVYQCTVSGNPNNNVNDLTITVNKI